MRIKAYMIVNQRNEARLNNAKKQISCLSTMLENQCDVVIINARMAKYLTSSELLENVALPTALNPGEIGCALSHVAVYKDFLSSSLDAVMVLEDDAMVEESSENQMRLQRCYEFVKQQEKPTILVLQKITGKRKIELFQSDGLTIFKNKNIWCTYGYMINRKAAQLVLELQTPVKFLADFYQVFHDICGVNIYGLDSNLVSVTQEFVEASEIGHEFADGILRKRAWLFRKYVRREIRKMSLIGYLKYLRRKRVE